MALTNGENMQLAEYQENALRTESKIEKVNTNYNMLYTTIDMYIGMCDVLDALKRSIYYGKDDRLENVQSDEWLADIEGRFNAFMAYIKEKDKHDLETNPRLLHGILGMATESGELCEALHKSSELNPFGEPLDYVNVHEELHDTSWYMAVIHDELQIVHDELQMCWEVGLDNNINKLKIRFPEKFTQENATNRNLIEERKALEGKS